MSKQLAWIVGVVATIVAGLTVFAVRWGVNFQMIHYAKASDTEARSEENEKKIAPIIDLVKELGERAKADDAALERDAELCRQGVLKDKMICGAAGEVAAE